jgi:Flp pilus assembly protein CpaB
VLATRHGALAVSLACALLAIVIVLIAIGQAQKTTKTAPQQATVLVATAAIPKGTSAQVIAAQHLYKEEPVLETQVSAGAVSNAASLVGTVTTANILPGEQLASTDFQVAHGAVAQLQSNQRAIAVTLDAQHGLSTALQAGDQVDVYGSFVPPLAKTPFVGLIVPDATVLSSTTSTSGGGATALLAISQDVATKVAFASDNGKIWLDLRPTGSSSNPSPGQTTITSITGGQR